MDSYTITYNIKLNENQTERFDFQLDNTQFDLIASDVENPPAWTALEYRQCAHCPLNAQDTPHCPLALQLHNIVNRLHKTRSIDVVEVEVITEERRIIQKTALQRVVASMLELVYPSCGCPKTAYMKPMARFHLPLSSEEETVYRVTSMYLLAQYFLNQTAKKGRIEFDGLNNIYADMHILNTAVASRLQTVTQSDSAKNAVTLVDMYSTLVPLLLEDNLAELRGFFKAYLPVGEETEATTNYLEKAKAFSLELTPIEGQKSKDDLPDWLKEVRGLKPVEDIPAKPAAATSAQAPVAAVKKPEPFITSSGLSLELAPISQDAAEEKPVAVANLARSGRAVFKLADD